MIGKILNFDRRLIPILSSREYDFRVCFLLVALTVTLVITSCYLPLAITLAITLVVILTPFTLSMVIAFWL